MAEILAGVAGPGPFSLRLAGGGWFRQVAWAGVDGDVAVLRSFRESVRDALTAGGFPSDERPFRPHLTVSYRGDDEVMSVLSGYSGEGWPVEEFTLFASVDREYRPLRTYDLTAATRKPTVL